MSAGSTTGYEIKRAEREMITGRCVPIDSVSFEDASSASAWLRERVHELTDAQVDEVFSSEYTTFQHRELINRGESAYDGVVVYEIKEVRGG